MAITTVTAQEDDPLLPYQVAPQNLLKFNRFLINPTFSTVREDNSYINLLHRNQSVSFDNNNQTYFLSYSGRVSDKSGLGLSLYSQKTGAVSNIGALANFAYGIKLSEKSNFTFGANVAYYSSGLNQNDLDPLNPIDIALSGREDSNVVSFQPGFNLSFGQFDFGAFAENLFDYNLKTSESLTNFNNKTYSAHLQYTYPFKNATGILESARVMPLARVRLNPQGSILTEESQDVSLGGSLILDLPKLGWIQGGYDTFYGASAGAGFNINQRLSLGYTMEKGFGTDLNNLGLTHEISLAYSFTPNLTEDRVMLEDSDELVDNHETDDEAMTSNDEVEELKKKLAENEEVLAELIHRQDSLEAGRQKDLERRFEMVMRMVRNETKGDRPDIERRAEQMFLEQKGNPTSLAVNKTNNEPYTSQITESIVTKNPEPNVVTQDNTNKNQIIRTNNRDAIKSRKLKNIDGANDGYYLIANVYKGGKYMNNFIGELNDRGFSSDYIDNPNDGLKYVYLEKYDSWQEAKDAYSSNMNGRYANDMWVLNIDNSGTSLAYDNNVNKIQQKSVKYKSNDSPKNIVVQDRVVSNDAKPRKFNIDGVGSGYYIIANVFANPNNAKKFVRLLNSYGLSASYFINPENNWRYVYLKKHESWNNALISYYSKLNDTYEDNMWIMRVNPNEHLA
jgi:type IX secretion system PorP/SprF family membrane protein